MVMSGFVILSRVPQLQAPAKVKKFEKGGLVFSNIVTHPQMRVSWLNCPHGRGSTLQWPLTPKIDKATWAFLEFDIPHRA